MAYTQQVKRAIAQYFGGAEQVALEGQGIYYSQGPLWTLGLTSSWPYQPKGIPDSLWFGQKGQAFGAILGVELDEDEMIRQALGGPVSGWRDLTVPAICHIWSMSTFPHAEQTETAMDDLIGPVPPGSGLISLTDLIFADRTLGSTNPVLYPTYPDNRLIIEAGEKPYGIHKHVDPAEEGVGARAGRVLMHAEVRFNVTTYWQS